MPCWRKNADTAAMKYKQCSQCNGTGKELDQQALGAEMRKLRESAGVSLRQMASELGYSASFLSDLELGRRKCRKEWIAAYKEVLGH
jgi:predicted transcriptional regulator